MTRLAAAVRGVVWFLGALTLVALLDRFSPYFELRFAHVLGISIEEVGDRRQFGKETERPILRAFDRHRESPSTVCRLDLALDQLGSPTVDIRCGKTHATNR